MRHTILSRMRNIIFVGVLLLLLIWAGRNADASPHHGRFEPNRHGLRLGTVVVQLPPGSINVRIGPVRCHYRGGVFYKKGRRGFVVVRAPVGAVVPVLPPGVRAVFVGGRTYYCLHGAYYRKIPLGYVVVNAPAGDLVTDASLMTDGARVTVRAALLNVRSGPGVNHPVVTRVRRGTVMTIRGQAADWFYAELPNGTFGWVIDPEGNKIELWEPPEGQ